MTTQDAHILHIEFLELLIKYSAKFKVGEIKMLDEVKQILERYELDREITNAHGDEL